MSKATAAALLHPGPAYEDALQRQAALQPLKFAHFAKREAHLALQLVQTCREHRSLQRKAQGAAAPAANSAKTAALKVVALVGRQYVPGLVAAWRDKGSALWRDRERVRPDAPSAFDVTAGAAPGSTAAPVGAVDDPDTLSGGSRPVGQTPRTLGNVFGAHERQE